MGAVWRAEDVEAQSWCAIKVLKPELARDPAAVARFVRERTALLALQHPNVVTLHDMIVEGERLALVMDLLADGDLDKFRREHGGTLPPGLAAELTAQVCDGLAAAHAAGIVHRDLKPANVLMDQGRARLTDFGIARISGDAPVTTEGGVIGTIRYMAPEVLAGGAPAPACDVYAAGVTLYELLAGQPPFTGQVGNVVYDHLQTSPQRPDGLPDPLWQLIADCLAKDPTARPTAAELAAALRRLAVPSDEPAAPPARTEAAALDTGPRTVTGPGRPIPAGATAPVAAEPRAAKPVAVKPVAAEAPLNQHAVKKRRRTWGIAAAALVVVAAAAGAVLTYGSGSASPPSATSGTSPTVTGPASPVGSGHSPGPSPSPSRSGTRAAAPSGGGAASPQSSASAPVSSADAAGSRATSTGAASPGTAPSTSVGAPVSATSPAGTPPPTVSGLVIKNSASNWCLRVAAASTAGGAHIQQGACATGDTAAQWRVVASVTLNGYPYHQYQNVHSGLCMGVHIASTAGGARILQGACSATTDHSQFWRTSDTGSGEYALINGHSGMCIGVVGSSTAENTDTDQGACASTGTQAWITVAAPQ